MSPNGRDPIDCDEAVRRLASWLDGELDGRRGEEVQRHLELCRSCFSRAEFERRLHERIRTELRPREVPPAFRARIHSLLEGFGPSGRRPDEI